MPLWRVHAEIHTVPSKVCAGIFRKLLGEVDMTAPAELCYNTEFQKQHWEAVRAAVGAPSRMRPEGPRQRGNLPVLLIEAQCEE